MQGFTVSSLVALRLFSLFPILFIISIGQANADNISSNTISSSSCTVDGPSAYIGSPNSHVCGLVGQLSIRGTIDIIWISLATKFISTYVISCLNVPSVGESWWSIAYHRILWMDISIAGPEFVLTAAAEQWAAAKRSVADFKVAEYESWMMKHTFFADMGGIEVNPLDFVPFRVHAKQLHYLITKGYLPYPNIIRKEISDKSKQNTFDPAVHRPHFAKPRNLNARAVRLCNRRPPNTNTWQCNWFLGVR